jgi:predicted metal-dependent HD superfamily phosphohydrolase
MRIKPKMNRILNFYDDVLDDICNKLLHELNPSYKYHTLRHTLDVIETSVCIAQAEGLYDDEMNVLKIAALFHDTGYLFQRTNHEQASVNFFYKVVSNYDFPEEEKEIIASCIMATSIPQHPKNILEKILCDADLDYLGRDDFYTISDLLFDELKSCGQMNSKEEWNKVQIKFISEHQYHTEYNKRHRMVKLHENLQGIRNTQNLV